MTAPPSPPFLSPGILVCRWSSIWLSTYPPCRCCWWAACWAACLRRCYSLPSSHGWYPSTGEEDSQHTAPQHCTGLDCTALFCCLLYGRVACSLSFPPLTRTHACTRSNINILCSAPRKRGFPEEWLAGTFAVCSWGNGVVAILAGFLAQVAAGEGRKELGDCCW